MHARSDRKQTRGFPARLPATPPLDGDPLSALRALLGSAEGTEVEPALKAWASQHLDSFGTIPSLGPAGWREAIALLSPPRTRPTPGTARHEIVTRLRHALDAFRRPDRSMSFEPGPSQARAARSTRPPIAFATYPGPVRFAIRDRVAAAEFLLALDDSQAAVSAHLELHAQGQAWLDGLDAQPTPPPMSRIEPAVWCTWTTTPEATLAESCKSTPDGTLIQRTVAWIRSRRLLILAEDSYPGPTPHSPATNHIALRRAVSAQPAPDGLGLLLTHADSPDARIRVLAAAEPDPPAPRIPHPTTLAFGGAGRPAWRPLLFILDPRLASRTPILRRLTLTEDRTILGPESASAFRLAWPGQATSLVIYRSRVPGGKRAFLGCQTEARLLIGSFSRKGELTPIIQLDGPLPCDVSANSQSTTSSSEYKPGTPRPSDARNACGP